MTHIPTNEEILAAIEDRRAHGQKIGLCNGCFDLLHPGHVFFLDEARHYCDHLVVGLNTLTSIAALNKDHPPYLDFTMRRFMLEKLEAVDSILEFDGDVEALLDFVRPDVVIRGAGQHLTKIEKSWSEDRIQWITGRLWSTSRTVRSIMERATYEIDGAHNAVARLESAVEQQGPDCTGDPAKALLQPSRAPRGLKYVTTIGDLHIYEDRLQWQVGTIVGKKTKTFTPYHYCATKRGLVCVLLDHFQRQSKAWLMKRLESFPDHHPASKRGKKT